MKRHKLEDAIPSGHTNLKILMLQGGYSLKTGGRGGPNGASSNIFAVGATTSNAAQRQDRSYYKSLYHFNADVELAEYSLPVLSNQQPPSGKAGSGLSGASQKMPSGVINATQLPPI